MSASGKSTKRSRTARAARLIAGARKHFASGEVLRYASAQRTTDEVTSGLHALVVLREEVEAAKAVLAGKLRAEEAQAPALCADMDAFEAFVRAAFGNSPDALADFGLAPRKALAPLTTEQQQLAVAKRKATREVRGTVGKRARLRVKGDVVGLVSTPVKAVAMQVKVTKEPADE
jgi:hypothetical protein